MAVIKSGNSTDQMTVDQISKAARVTLYDTSGNVISDSSPISVKVTNSLSLTGEVEIKNDTGNPVPVNGTVSATQSGTWNVTNVSGTVSLPTGASTLAAQTTGNSNLSSLDGKTPSLGQALAAGSVPIVLTATQLTTLTPLASITVTQATGTNLHTTVDNFPATQAISATSLPLPTGASTEATLSSLNSKVTAVNTGAVVVSSSALPTGAATSAKQPALGVAGSASSDVITIQGINSMTPIKVDASATTQPISGSVTVTQSTGINLHTVVDSGTVSATQSGTWNINNISGTVSLPTGAATESSLAKLTQTQGSTTSGQSGSLHLGAVTTASPAYTNGQSSPISLTTAGATRVDGSSVTQPISGTVASTQSGTWNVNNISGTVTLPTGASTSANQTTTNSSLSSIDSKTATLVSGRVPVDGSGVTQPISGSVTVTQATGTNLHAVIDSGTLAATQSGTWNINNVTGTVSLPTGASTEATLTKLPLAQGSTTSGQSGTLTQGAVSTAAPSYTNAQTSPISLTTSGLLRVDGSGVTQPVSGTVTANAGSGSFTVAQATGTNLHTVVDSGSITVSNFPSTQNVSVTNTPSVTVSSGSISINNTPAVTISGTAAVTGTVNADVRTGGSAVSAANPLQSSIIVAGAAVASSNPLPTTTVITNAAGNNIYQTYQGYTALIEVIPATTLTAGTTYYAVRNTGAKTVYIRSMDLVNNFNGTAGSTRSSFDFQRISAATPTGGTAITSNPKNSGNASSSLASIQNLATGLTTTGVTFGSVIHRTSVFSQLSTGSSYGLNYDTGDESNRLVLASGEGFVIRAQTTIVAGCAVYGSFQWDER